MRTALVLVLAACGGTGASDAGPPAAKSAPPVAKPVEPPITATHGATIVRLAVTDDGTAAVSADATGGIRLWPALDGSREPFVVHAAVPSALGIARDRDGFVIADQDGARGVELIRFAPSGQVRGRVALAPDPEIAQVVMTASGALVRRADHSIELVDAGGAYLARIVPESGVRVRALVARAGRVLAIVQDDEAVRARWIELAEGSARWGEKSARLPLDPEAIIALSPDHARVVGRRRDRGAPPVLVQLATGSIEAEVCAKSEPGGIASDVDVLGVLDGRTVACTVGAFVEWWSVTGKPLVSRRAAAKIPSGMEFALGGNQLFGGLSTVLGIYGPDDQHFLGYRVSEVTSARVTRRGLLVGRLAEPPMLVDPQLRELPSLVVPAARDRWTDLYPLDERYLLAVGTRPERTDAWGPSYEVVVIDTVKQVIHQRLPNRAAGAEVVFEPATQLLLTSDGITQILLRFDPRTHSFVERIDLASGPFLPRVYLLDPALSDGVVAIGIHDEQGRDVLVEFYAADQRDNRIVPRASYRVTGTIDAVDRAGNAYGHAPDPVVLRHGVRGAKLPATRAEVVRPSRDGASFASLGDGRIEVVSTTTGRILWQALAWDARDLVWLPTGDLLVRYARGLARLDGATGVFADRQCGWSFGLADTAFGGASDAPLVCDVAP